MADISDHIRKTLDELRAALMPTAMVVRNDLALINSMEQRYGLPPTTFDDLVGSGEIASESPAESTFPSLRRSSITPSPRPGGSHLSIRADQYFGREPLDAAKMYLADLGHAAHLDQISEAIQKGGVAVKGATWREALEMSLLKSVYDVVKVQDHTFGLIRFYSEDQIKQIRDMRRQTATGKKGKRGRPKKQKSKGYTSTAEKANADKPSFSPEQIARMKELQAEGKSYKEIAQQFGVHHLAVYHLLGGKLKAAKPSSAA